jgi:hypothetical protein
MQSLRQFGIFWTPERGCPLSVKSLWTGLNADPEDGAEGAGAGTADRKRRDTTSLVKKDSRGQKGCFLPAFEVQREGQRADRRWTGEPDQPDRPPFDHPALCPCYCLAKVTLIFWVVCTSLNVLFFSFRFGFEAQLDFLGISPRS